MLLRLNKLCKKTVLQKSVLLRDSQPTQRIGIVARFIAAMPFFYLLGYA